MILYEIVGTEENPVYQDLEISNGNRQYDFLRSIVDASLRVGRPFLSQTILKALNAQAIMCLHTHAGEYRPCQVEVGTHKPPAHFRVQALMEDFVDQVNRRWESTDPVVLATYVLWRVNHIHPFINGNGRTARAASYYVLCVAAGGWLPGSVILPELLRQNRPEYVEALRIADQPHKPGENNLQTLHELVARLLGEQLASANVAPTPNGADQ